MDIGRSLEITSTVYVNEQQFINPDQQCRLRVPEASAETDLITEEPMKTTIPSFGATAPAKKPEAETVKGAEGENVPEDITAFYR